MPHRQPQDAPHCVTQREGRARAERGVGGQRGGACGGGGGHPEALHQSSHTHTHATQQEEVARQPCRQQAQAQAGWRPVAAAALYHGHLLHLLGAVRIPRAMTLLPVIMRWCRAAALRLYVQAYRCC